MTTEPVISAAACHAYEAMFDAVTRLPRWPLLIDRTDIALARAERSIDQVVVVVLDQIQTFDGTAPDLHGIADALRPMLRRCDTIARVDVGTLVVVCNDVSADTDAAQIARRLVAHAGITCNVGVSFSAGHDDAKSLLTAAVNQARGHLEPS